MTGDKLVKIDIGGGNNPKDGFLCVDRCFSANYVVNLETNSLPFNDESIDEIYTNHTLEHISDLIHLMNEMWRVMKWDAILTIIVPHVECSVAFQDPTHVRYFNRNSMKYFEGYYVNKHKLDYGINCVFKEILNETNVINDFVENLESFPCYKEQKFVLKKDREWFKINYRDW